MSATATDLRVGLGTSVPSLFSDCGEQEAGIRDVRDHPRRVDLMTLKSDQFVILTNPDGKEFCVKISDLPFGSATLVVGVSVGGVDKSSLRTDNPLERRCDRYVCPGAHFLVENMGDCNDVVLIDVVTVEVHSIDRHHQLTSHSR